MLETSARLLRLLSLLQSRPEWPGSELAERLSVNVRTVRRDVDRLRELGYPVIASRGSAGYRLGAGSQLPPLLFDDEEIVAVSVGLRTISGGPVIAEAALRAMVKLEQILPSRLRHRLAVLQRTLTSVRPVVPTVEPETLIAVSEACHRHERLRFDYTDNQNRKTRRDVEPHAVINFSRHWYLIAFDVLRDQWRSFRIDRLEPRIPTGPVFVPRQPPEGDFAGYLSSQLSVGAWPWQATVVLHRPAAELADRIWVGMGVLEAVDHTQCLLHVGGDSPAALSWMIISIDTDFTLEGPPELIDHLRELGDRCLRAIPPAS